MAKFSYEPNRVAGGVGTVLVMAALALLVHYGVLDTEGAGLWAALLLPLVPIASAEIARRFTWPTAKIADAHAMDDSFDPENIEQKARQGRRRKETAKEGRSV